jgi:DNA repair exonuclease SbcCD ATPase subunit
MHKEIIILNKISTIEKIIHVSDIHIRNFKRHDEYSIVFERFYDHCKKTIENTPNTIIYVAGDVVHAKTDMSPELIVHVRDFLKSVADLAPTILIAGNHDCNLNNKTRLDALSPIVDSIDNENLMYLKETGVYTINNVDFILNSVYESPENFILAKDIPGDNTKVVLFHGAVDMAATDIGMTMKNKSITIEKFKGFDYGMFGDIHKFQYLDPEAKFAYAGSLIQQNFGEGLVHGIIEWDLKNKKSKFVKIENDWSYHTIEVDNGIIKHLPEEFSKNNCIRLKSSNTTNADLFKIITKLKSNINVSDIKIQRVSNRLTTQTQNTTKLVGDIRDVDYQNKLIVKYITNRFNVSNDILDTICFINTETNKKLIDNDVVRNVIWEPILFEFDNMFSYAEDNKITFQYMNGIYGLFAPNASGKTSTLDALMFCIFDKCSRTFKASQVLNNKKEDFKCRFQFKISDKDYFIERVGVKDKKGNVKVNVDFWTGDNDNRTYLNGDDRDSTNQIIRKYLGTYDDFVLTAMSVQGNNTNFIDKTQKDRKDLLTQFLDLNVFEELNAIASDEIKSVQTLIKECSKQDYSTKIADSNVKYKKYNTLLDETIDEKNVLQEKIDELSSKIFELNNNILQIDSDINSSSLQELEEKEYQLNKKQNQYKNDIVSLNGDLKESIPLQTKYSDLIANFDKKELTSKQAEMEIVRQAITKHNTDLRELDLQIQHCNSKIDNLSNHQYDPDCKFCCNNVFVIDAQKSKEKLIELLEEKDHITKEVNILSETFSKNSSVYDDLNKLYKCENDLFYHQKEGHSIEKKIYSINSSLNDIDDHLLNIQAKILKFKENENAIKANIETNDIIKQLESEKNFIKNSKLKELESLILEYSGEVKVHERIINECAESIKKLQELEKQFYAYDYYLKAINRNGVPYELISEALPKIQSEANNILLQIVDFQVLFDTDGKSINTYIVYDDERFWPLEMASGMEKFISSMAIRTSLINVSALPRPNFIAIDEGLGSLDPSILNNFSAFLDYLKTQFEFVILISHIDIVKDIVDYQIEIKKENGYSKIET